VQWLKLIDVELYQIEAAEIGRLILLDSSVGIVDSGWQAQGIFCHSVIVQGKKKIYIYIYFICIY
jgi:hypothetical protein